MNGLKKSISGISEVYRPIQSRFFLDKSLFDNLLEYAIAYEKYFRMVKHVKEAKVEYCEYRQINVLKKTNCLGNHITTFSDGFQKIYLVLQQVHLSEELAKFLKNV